MKPQLNTLTLTKEEKESALWKKVEAHITQRIDLFRRQNDGALTIEDTAKLRGKIAFAKEMLGCSGNMAD